MSSNPSQALPAPRGTSAPAEASAPHRGVEYKWKVLMTVIFGIFMVILDTTVVNVAFQTLREEFGIFMIEVQSLGTFFKRHESGGSQHT